jgi:pimeloyl-ACP methyl ester carboxylesterase
MTPTAAEPAHQRVASAAAPLPPLGRPIWLPPSAWPFDTRAFTVEGATLAVTDVGRGPILLFVHTGFWSFVWRNVIQRLSSDFRCVCFDAPSTGQSDRLPVQQITLGRAARALTAVIERLDLRDITLVVHDLGGPSGIAGAAPVADRVRALCAVNAFAWKPSGAAFRGMLALMGSAAVREFDAWTRLLPKITSTSFGIGRSMTRADRDVFLSGIDRQAARAFHAYLHDARNEETLYTAIDRALRGPFRTLPVSTVFGERNDPLGFQPQWKQRFPAVTQIVVANGNHFPMCDDPDLVAKTIRDLHHRI